MGFQIDMSPLERSSMNIGQSLANAGQSIGQSMLRDKQQAQQQDSEEQVQDLLQRSMSGDSQAFQELMAKSPQAARMVAEQLQGQQETQKQDEIDFNSERSIKTARFVEQMYRAPKEQQAEMFELGLGDDSIDLDEGDRILSQDPKAQEDLITRSALATMEPKAAEIYLNRFFGEGDKEKSFTLAEGQKRYDSKGNEIASVLPKEKAIKKKVEPIPQELLKDLSDSLSLKAEAAYVIAGGGKDGFAAFTRIVDTGTEQERRSSSPALLSTSFPQASSAEMAQLQSSMDSAKNTNEGMKNATKVRNEQRRLKKAKGFQERAVSLLDGILSKDDGVFGGDLGDVLGSVEGSIDFRLFSDDEAELISDIGEAENILTADNLSLMSGVLSESDIKIITNLAGGALNRKRSKARFVKDVTILRDKLKSQIVMTADDVEEARGGSAEDKKALEWAKANPGDDRSKQIMIKLGGK